MEITPSIRTKILRFALVLAAFLVMPVYGVSGVRGSLPAGCIVAILILLYAVAGAGLLLVQFARTLKRRFFSELSWKTAVAIALAANLLVSASALLLTWRPGIVAMSVLVFAGTLLVAGAAWAIGQSLHWLWDLSGPLAETPSDTARITARNSDQTPVRTWNRPRAGARVNSAGFRRQGRVRP